MLSLKKWLLTSEPHSLGEISQSQFPFHFQESWNSLIVSPPSYHDQFTSRYLLHPFHMKACIIRTLRFFDWSLLQSNPNTKGKECSWDVSSRYFGGHCSIDMINLLVNHVNFIAFIVTFWCFLSLYFL